VPAETKLDRDRVITRLASVASHCDGKFRLKGDEHLAQVNGIYSPVQDFTGPIGLYDRCGHRGCDGEDILVESWGGGQSPHSRKPILEPS
jgi:hypothetical protein